MSELSTILLVYNFYYVLIVLIKAELSGLEYHSMSVSYTHLDVYKRQVPSYDDL